MSSLKGIFNRFKHVFCYRCRHNTDKLAILDEGEGGNLLKAAVAECISILINVALVPRDILALLQLVLI